MREELIKSWLRRGLAVLFSTLGTGRAAFGSAMRFRRGKIGPTSADGEGLTSSRRFPDAEPRAVERWSDELKSGQKKGVPMRSLLEAVLRLCPKAADEFRDPGKK